MSNITPIVSSLLTSHASTPIHTRAHSTEQLESFLQEAYRINSHIASLIHYLRQVRRPYLSTVVPPSTRARNPNAPSNSSPASAAYLTDAQRDAIDTETSTLLQSLSGNISSLTAAENLRTSTETALLEKRYGNQNSGSLLWQWAAGDSEDNQVDPSLGKKQEQLDAEGQAFGLKVHRESVLWYLGWRLQEALNQQRGMVEVRAAREREKAKSVLWKTRAMPQPNGSAVGGGDQSRAGVHNQTRQSSSFQPHLENEQGDQEEEIPANLRQLFESENSELLQHYETTLSKVQAAEKSLLEISSLQQTLVGHLSTQGEMIEQLVSDAAGTGENLTKGNRELKRAGERWGKGLARSTFWATVGICSFCIVWDLIF